MRRLAVITLALACSLSFAQAPANRGVLPENEARKVIPSQFFFHGQLADTQQRNAAAVRTQDARLWMAALVDTSGYSSAVAQRVQGFLITEADLTVNGKPLAPGVYAIGGDEQGNFIVQDLGRKDALTVSAERDADLKSPRPLQVQKHENAWRLYLGRRFVTVETR